MSRPPRTFVEEQTYSACLDSLGVSVARLDEVVGEGGLQLQLCRDPDGGARIPGTHVYVRISAGSFPDAPALAILYRFDDEYVYALWIEPY